MLINIIMKLLKLKDWKNKKISKSLDANRLDN